MMKHVDIYTDGACSGNPGAGGWCAILIYGGTEKTVTGGEKDTTNNRMELMAVIQGLRCLKYACDVSVYSDSAYVCNAIENDWLNFWVNNGWRTAGKKDVKNIDLWQELIAETSKHTVRFVKVKGHADNAYNNMCDKCAREEINKLRNNSQVN